MNQTIRNLSDDDAVRIFTTIAEHHFSDQEPKAELPRELIAALADELGVEADAGRASDGDVAREALELLATDEQLKGRIADMAQSQTTPAAFGTGGILLSVAVVMLLKSYIKIERDKDGKWSFSFESKPLDKGILAELVKKLAIWSVPG
jgi:hypothetical protein